MVYQTLLQHFISEEFSNKMHIKSGDSALPDQIYYVFSMSVHCEFYLLQVNQRNGTEETKYKWAKKQFESAIVSEVIGNFICSSFNTLALSRARAQTHQAVWVMNGPVLFSSSSLSFFFVSVILTHTLFVIILFRKYVYIVIYLVWSWAIKFYCDRSYYMFFFHLVLVSFPLHTKSIE